MCQPRGGCLTESHVRAVRKLPWCDRPHGITETPCEVSVTVTSPGASHEWNRAVVVLSVTGLLHSAVSSRAIRVAAGVRTALLSQVF